METALSWWLWFNLFLAGVLALDLGVFHRKSHAVGMRAALTWTGAWMAVALAFNALVYWVRGPEPAWQFLTAYLIEKALAVDNVFVIALIFSMFAVPAAYQHRVLFWGIGGALAMRAACIFAGVALLERFHWLMYVFGAFLIFTGVKMLWLHGKRIEPENNLLVKAFRRFVPCTPSFRGDNFLVHEGGRLLATPLLLTLLFVEFTDLAFAVDSIPAVLAVSRDPFIVYTSNALAILGLRSLYFALAGLIGKFRYLHYGLAAILTFVGAKLLLVDVVHVPVLASLATIGGLLAISLLASCLSRPPRDEEAAASATDSGGCSGFS